MATLAVIAALSANAQNEVDALRYSQISFGGTARYDGMAGAFGALGADFSTLSSNPAGLGLYRKSEITFTPSALNASTSSSYMSTPTGTTYVESASKYSQSWGNAGIVGAWSRHKEPEEGGWQNFNMGFGYNQLADFNNSQSMTGYNYSNASLGNYFANITDGTSVQELNSQTNNPAYAAYNAYLINPTTLGNGANQYVTGMPTGGVLQSNSVTTGGTMGEIVLSFASNYENKLYIGGTIGFDRINYWSNSTYSETALHDSIGGLHSFNMAQNVNTTGQGVNVKLGVIYRVNDWFRVGLAAHSPTQFSMNDQYSTNINSKVAGNDSTLRGSSSGSYNYTLTTPGRIIGSLGFIILKKGLVDIDVEYVDYTTASLSSSDPGVFSTANTAIQNKYQATENIRLGAEWKLVDIFAIRAGLAYYGNPYQSSANIDASRTSMTLGCGLREKYFTLDLAYVMTQYSENYWLYDPTVVAVNPVKNTYTLNSLMLTMGFKF